MNILMQFFTCFFSQQQSFFFQEKPSQQASVTAVARQRVPVGLGKVDLDRLDYLIIQIFPSDTRQLLKIYISN